MAGYVMRHFTCPKAVTHPSTNRARCRATALIETNALPLHQTANQKCDLLMLHVLGFGSAVLVLQYVVPRFVDVILVGVASVAMDSNHHQKPVLMRAVLIICSTSVIARQLAPSTFIPVQWLK